MPYVFAVAAHDGLSEEECDLQMIGSDRMYRATFIAMLRSFAIACDVQMIESDRISNFGHCDVVPTVVSSGDLIDFVTDVDVR